MNNRFFASFLTLIIMVSLSAQVFSETTAEELTKLKAEISTLKTELQKLDKGISKIGFVNVGQLLGVAPQAQESKGILEKEFASRDKELVAKQNVIIEKEKAYQKDLAILSEAERAKRELKLISLKRNFKRLKEEFEEDLALRKNEELRKLQKIVALAIDKVAKAGEFDLIVNEGVIYAGKNIDISLLVLEELKKTVKAKNKKAKKKDAKSKKK